MDDLNPNDLPALRRRQTKLVWLCVAIGWFLLIAGFVIDWIFNPNRNEAAIINTLLVVFFMVPVGPIGFKIARLNEEMEKHKAKTVKDS